MIGGASGGFLRRFPENLSHRDIIPGGSRPHWAAVLRARTRSRSAKSMPPG